VDLSLIDWQNPFGLDPAKVVCLGEFAVGDNQSQGMDTYLDELLDEALMVEGKLLAVAQGPE